MSVYYRPPVKRKGKRAIAIVSALVIVLFFADWFSGGYLRAGVRTIGASTSGALAAVGASVESSGLLSSKASLEASNHMLVTQVATLSEQAAQAAYLQQQNDQLRALLGLSAHGSGFAAPIVSTPGSSPYGTFVIGVPEGETIAHGDLVLTRGGFVIGVVSDVRGGTAVVTETLGPRTSTEAQLDGADVVIAGAGGGNGQTDMPRGVTVAIGDAATSQALGGRPVGVVGAIASSSASAAQTVYLRLPSNLSGLQYVYVASGTK